MEGFEGHFYYFEMSVYRKMLKSGLSDTMYHQIGWNFASRTVWSVRSSWKPLNPLNCNLGQQKKNLVRIFCFSSFSQNFPLDSQTWALVSEPGFLTFQIFRFSILELFFCWTIVSKIMLVRYRGINNKGVLERPWTKWKVLRAISTTLKCQFTVKCWKVDFLTTCKTKSCQSSTECLRMVRALLPDTPRPPQFQPELWKKQLLWKTWFFSFFQIRLLSVPGQ